MTNDERIDDGNDDIITVIKWPFHSGFVSKGSASDVADLDFD